MQGENQNYFNNSSLMFSWWTNIIFSENIYIEGRQYVHLEEARREISSPRLWCDKQFDFVLKASKVNNRLFYNAR